MLSGMSGSNGVVLRKLALLEEVLAELRSAGTPGPEALARDWKLRRAVERDLQILVEVVIDVCQRLLSLAGQPPAASGAEAVRRCVALGALSSEEPYRRMVQFRNFVVHRCDAVRPEVLAEILREHLDGFERFRREILAHVRREVELERLNAVLAAEPGLLAAWLFGSCAAGRTHPGSDIDIALLYEPPPALARLAALRAGLQEALGMEDVDLVLLDEETPSVLAFEAVSGRLLHCRDRDRLAAYVSEIARQYEDDMALAGAGLRAMRAAPEPRPAPGP